MSATDLILQSAKKLLTSGVDTITSGNHIWREKKEMHSWLDEAGIRFFVRQTIMPAPGSSCHIITDVCGYRLLIINVLGVIYMEPLENPIRCISEYLTIIKGADFAALDVYMRSYFEKLQLEDALTGKISDIRHAYACTDC